MAAIASIEIPRKEWDDIVPNLCLNAEHTDYNVRLTSLTTLGYICEEIRPEDLSDPVKNQVILALTNNMSNSQAPEALEPCRVASKALVHSIPYATQNFKVKNERDYIMDRIFQACGSSNEEVFEYALTCLTDVTTQEYEGVVDYFNKICEVTAIGAKHSSPKVGARAYEYWTTLVEDETERIAKGAPCVNFIAGCASNLIELILEGLGIITFDEDDDDDEWGHALSAALCL